MSRNIKSTNKGKCRIYSNYNNTLQRRRKKSVQEYFVKVIILMILIVVLLGVYIFNNKNVSRICYKEISNVDY